MSDQRYKEIVDLIREAFIAFDGGGRFVFVNRRAEELLGKESGFLVGRNFPEAFPDLLDRPFYHQLQRVFSEKVPLSLELDDSPFGVGAQIRSCPRPDGVWLFASEAAKERVAQALEEETAINGALLELDALRQSEERYRALFEQAGTGIAHVSLAGRFIEVNSKLCDILGYPREELLELTWQDITHPDDISLGGDNVERLLRRLASSFSLEKLLQDSFGVHSGKDSHAVAIRFDPLVADYIREKRWHPSQKIRELPDGGLELRLRLSSLGEIQRWILSWGGSAVALSPPALVTSIRQAARTLARHHG